MILTLATLLFAPAALPSPAPPRAVCAAPAPQWSVLRKLGKKASKLKGASAAKRLAGKADDVFRHLPDTPSSHAVVMGPDADGFRLFTRGGAPEGITVSGGEGLAGRIRAIAGSNATDVVLDITIECVGIAADLADEGVDVYFLGTDDELLELVSYEPGTKGGPFVEVENGVLAPLIDADSLSSLLETMSGKFDAAEVGLLGVFDEGDVERWQRELAPLAPSLRQLDVVRYGDSAAVLKDLAPDPVLLIGHIDKERFAALTEIHGGPIMAFAFASGGESAQQRSQLTAGLASTEVGGLLEALVPRSGPLVLRTLEGDEDAWVASTFEDAPSPVMVMAQGVGPRGMRSAPPTIILVLVAALFLGGPAIPLGRFFAGLFGFHPKTWRRLKFMAIGLGPFLPFALPGIAAFLGVLLVYWISFVTGWILMRVLRLQPKHQVLQLEATQQKRTQKTLLVGLCGITVLVGLLFAAKLGETIVDGSGL